ncbi:hypothetical protein [Desulfosporosinus sp. FKB]|uniref:hypothetical protein n=1 Tax=Desulfosporosinus sp. FKB TaxID=1969835 RepID=UPI000B49722B|nr:hypothetical protein [Desulfosporosinus sp. FKB]
MIGQEGFASALASMQRELSQWEISANQVFNQVQTTTTAWEVSTETTLTKAQGDLSSWVTNSSRKFREYSSTMVSELKTGYSSVSSLTNDWTLETEQRLSSMVASAGSAITTFTNNLHNSLNQVFQATGQMAVSWANSMGQTITSAVSQVSSEMQSLAAMTGQAIPNMASTAWQSVTGAYSSVANWAETNKSWLVPLGAAAGGVGFTLATGGTDLLAGGIAAAGSALAGIGAAIPAMASGGIVIAPQLAMIGEAGPEAVIPLEKLGSLMSSGHSGSAEGNGLNSGTQPIQVTLTLDGRTLARTLYSYTVNENDRIGKMIGYNSSYNLPK